MSAYPCNIILNVQNDIFHQGFNGIQFIFTACRNSLGSVRYSNKESTTKLLEATAFLDRDRNMSAYPCKIIFDFQNDISH